MSLMSLMSLILVGLVVIIVSGILYLIKLAALPALVVGIIGIVMSGLLSSSYYKKAGPLKRMLEATEGIGSQKVIPRWVSLINLASFGCLIYGVVRLFVNQSFFG